MSVTKLFKFYGVSNSARHEDFRKYFSLVCMALLMMIAGPVLAGEPVANQCSSAMEGRMSVRTNYGSINVDGINIFYREAGNSSCPTILLLHGFSSSSHMFRELMPLLAETFHLVAPDYPGFGYSDAPSAQIFNADFVSLAEVMEKFVQAMGLESFIVYMQDFGGPVGFMVAEQHPEWISGLIIQNANAYMEGLVMPKPTATEAENETDRPAKTSDKVVNESFIRHLYQYGVRDVAKLNPDAWTVDIAVLQNPDAKRIQSALIDDYANNIRRYAKWQHYLRTQQPKTLVVWGKNDQAFSVAGANAFQQDIPNALVQLFDTGHFALEEDVVGIAQAIEIFFANQ